MMPGKFSPEKEKAILADYDNGMLLKQMAYKHNMKLKAISMYVIRRGRHRLKTTRMYVSALLWNGLLGFGI